LKTFIQALGTEDHAAIAQLIGAGEHPLWHLEFVIEMRGNAIATLMQYVPDNCAEIIKAKIDHLEQWSRYPLASREMRDWLESKTLPIF
jgi:hypothetical protein